MPADAMMAMLVAGKYVVVLVAKLAWFVLNGCNVTLVHATKEFNGESCVNVGNVGSNSSTVAAMSDDSGGDGNSSCGGCG